MVRYAELGLAPAQRVGVIRIADGSGPGVAASQLREACASRGEEGGAPLMELHWAGEAAVGTDLRGEVRGCLASLAATRRVESVLIEVAAGIELVCLAEALLAADDDGGDEVDALSQDAVEIVDVGAHGARVEQKWREQQSHEADPPPHRHHDEHVEGGHHLEGADDHEQEQQHAVEPQLPRDAPGEEHRRMHPKGLESPHHARGGVGAFRDVVDTVVELPVKMPTSVTIGGPRLDTLFITTRAENGRLDAGSLFACRIYDVVGVPEPEYIDRTSLADAETLNPSVGRSSQTKTPAKFCGSCGAALPSPLGARLEEMQMAGVTARGARNEN